MKILRLETNQNNRKTISTSSKGNQIKWKLDNMWLKADYSGFESLSEIVASHILKLSNINDFAEYKPAVIYDMDLEKEFRGCMSFDFLEEGEELITLARLFQCNHLDIYREIEKLDTTSRIMFIIENTEKFTGLSEFSKWLCKLLEFDAFILNDDRHFHNIAVIKSDSSYRTIPVFDNGSSFLSDRNFYSLTIPFEKNLKKVKSKPFNTSFDKQVKAVFEITGQQLKLEKFSLKILDELESLYSYSEINTIKKIIEFQIEKYSYLF